MKGWIEILYFSKHHSHKCCHLAWPYLIEAARKGWCTINTHKLLGVNLFERLRSFLAIGGFDVKVHFTKFSKKTS